MILTVQKSGISGKATMPGSKSHTIRALFIASLAGGTSVIKTPLISDDTMAAADTCKAFGADIILKDGAFIVKGFGKHPNSPDGIIDTRNSGTTLSFGLSVAALGREWTVLTGDSQVSARPLDSLISALNNLGGHVFSANSNGKPPVAGLSIEGITSISTAEVVNMTFPQFVDIVRECGGTILFQ